MAKETLLLSLMTMAYCKGMNCGDIRKVKSTLGTFSCQECPSIFLSKNDLKKHKKTAKHDLDLDRVICAFCVQKEQREFRRVGDLRFHIKTKHATELLDAPEGLLTTRTVFYFALEPLNYLKEHRAEKFDDPAAVYARQLVTRWCTGRTPGVSKWLAGWELAKGSPNTGEKRPSTSLELIDVCIAPKEIKAHFSLGETYLMAKVDLSISEDFRGMDSLSRRQRAIQCSTEIPSGSWKVLNNPETKAESAALLGIQEHYIYVLLHKPKPSFHAKVQKVSETQTHVSPSEAPDAPNTQPASPEGANDDLMQEVMKSCGILPPFSPIPSPPPIHLGPADEGTSNDTEDPFPQVTVLSTSASLSPALPDVMTSFPDASVSTPVALLPSNKSTPPPEVPTVEVVPPPPAVSSDEVVSLPPVVSSNVDVGPPSPVVSTNEVVLPPPAVSRDEIVSPPPAVSSCSSFVEVVPPTNTSQENCPSVVSMSTVSQVMTSSAIDSLPLLSCSSNSCSLFTGTTPVYCCSSVAPTPTYEPTMIGGQRPSEVIYKPTPILSSDIVRQRARTLLTKGCMPLLPPARRDWNVIPDQSIQLCPGLLWPPANWKSMLADQRSLAVEFAALTLLRRTGTTSFFPDRFPLVHQYNFLVLPGSGPYKTDIRGKARVYNYEAVSRIINGQDMSPLSDQMDFLSCFNPGSGIVNQDVLQKISAVPLRLK